MNNNKPSSKKSLFISIAILVVAGIAFFYFQGRSSGDVGSLSIQQNPEVNAASGRVFALLSQISSLHIDASLFSDAAYKTLRDYSVSIPADAVGRSNPFAPIPGFVPAAPVQSPSH